ncbi:MAG TPA: DUF721 domain-containing protein [Phycisphaerae bacterium]|nr:DUF721 domain-containing protein [Phycisphaerae bacterium]
MDSSRLEQAWRNRRRAQRAVPLGMVLGPMHQRLAAEVSDELAAVRVIWRDVVPEGLAAESEVVALKGGRLCVAVGSAADRYMLQWAMHDQLVAAINKALGRSLVRRIRCELRTSGSRGQV